MHGILVDSNVLLDVFLDDPEFAEWSEKKLNEYSLNFPLYINPIIYSEISIGFQEIELLEEILEELEIKMLQLPKEALFLAGKVYLKYKKRSGIKKSVLPDFYIGAQAAVHELPILTRDRGRYSSYFPTVELISP